MGKFSLLTCCVFQAISRTWIVYNKPEAATFAHAGVLMGLGLQVSPQTLIGLGLGVRG